ncbi:hypothetical protein [Corynebacterium parakroppenstedtii]|uniref:hypothetical protein n=1 Tax=Corynebacterium parakroppenstedtii TaxID=2828363 RepID=UPI0030ECDD5E
MRPSTRQHLINNIPAPRFQTYLDAAQQDPDKAFALYQWNIEVAAAVTSTLAIVEIALRDTIDQQLRKWNTIEGGTDQWITQPRVPLAHIVRPTPPSRWSNSRKRRTGELYGNWWEARALGAMKDALGNRTNRTPCHDDLVASLSFGTWRHLIPKPVSLGGRSAGPQVHIWKDAINLETNICNDGKGFNASAGAAYYWCSTLLYARNRASHLEPLLDVDALHHWHRVASRTVKALWPDAEVWITGPARIPRVIRRRPL